MHPSNSLAEVAAIHHQERRPRHLHDMCGFRMDILDGGNYRPYSEERGRLARQLLL
ncbi:hypothetical protein Esi_0262_0030 [Ectocarpus siliculosus]|uniref:Uncharacterized protein n=1 Tax=Ectocarpus siliculosus TaxID=2880 RepID=D7FU08_ECTSI|nr:hypothetical protein Esi_0262_0030 [Ectocarpus siliculosus]|eukprot:CBJ31535.1 hypothetical protein Esi_0262_0030 [Ectocarpus siliculosus]